ncbi:MAG: hypothetical protein PHU71_00495 [Candidatus Gracilibacteria bacterium]|nr:hypothetical protein [Candidatus Gracilibacteria bacterium]
MHQKKFKFDGVLLIAIITTTLGILGGMSFASLPYINFSSEVGTDPNSTASGNASSLNLLGEQFGENPSIRSLFEYILAGWVGVTAIFAVAGLIVGAFLYITAHGNEEQLGKAKQYIGLTILGLTIASLAYLIVRLVVGIFY